MAGGKKQRSRPLREQNTGKTTCGETRRQIEARCGVHHHRGNTVFCLSSAGLQQCGWPQVSHLNVCDPKHTCTTGTCRDTNVSTDDTHTLCRLSRTVYCPPMVQFVVIFLRFGLCRNNSNSLLVGSHVVYFSPMPAGTKEETQKSVTAASFFWTKLH